MSRRINLWRTTSRDATRMPMGACRNRKFRCACLGTDGAMNRNHDNPDSAIDVYRRIFLGTVAGSGVTIGLGLPLAASAEGNSPPVVMPADATVGMTEMKLRVNGDQHRLWLGARNTLLEG